MCQSKLLCGAEEMPERQSMAITARQRCHYSMFTEPQ